MADAGGDHGAVLALGGAGLLDRRELLQEVEAVLQDRRLLDALKDEQQVLRMAPTAAGESILTCTLLVQRLGAAEVLAEELVEARERKVDAEARHQEEHQQERFEPLVVARGFKLRHHIRINSRDYF